MKLIIELLSDTCVSSGESIAGIIDTDVVFDKYKIPYIPGKRIKGLFREAAEDLQELGVVNKETVEKVFGISGQIYNNNVYFGNAKVLNYESFYENVENLNENIHYKELVNKKYIEDYFTYVRTQTSINQETGASLKNSLRNIRVIKKGTKFEANIDVDSNMTEIEKELLSNCAKLIRHMGVSRTRGLGLVKCRIEKDCQEEKNTQKLKSEANEIKYFIKCKQPCIIDQNYIPGNVILGIFAKKYIDKYNLSPQIAHKNKEFRKLFLSNSTIFESAMPYARNKRFIPTPLTFLKEKGVDGNKIYDLAEYDIECDDSILDDKEKLGVSFINIDEDKLDIYDVEDEIIYHHRRPKDKTIGHALGEGKEDNGQFYSYRAIKEGSTFSGKIVTSSKEDLQIIKALIEDNKKIYIGKSRTAQYGLATIEYDNTNSDVEFEELDNTIIIFETPMIMMNERGVYTTDLNEITKYILNDYDIEDKEVDFYSDTTIISGYNAKWRMPKEQIRAIKEGTVIVIKDFDLEEDEIKTLVSKRYGKQVNEGFGKININIHGHRYKENKSYTIQSHKQNDLTINLLNNFNDTLTKNYISYRIRLLLEEIILQKASSEENNYFKSIKNTIKNISENTVIENINMMIKVSNNFRYIEEQMNHAKNKEYDNKINSYEKIFKVLLDNESNIKEAFIKNAEITIENSKILRHIKDEMKKILEDKMFDIFKEIVLDIIYHIKLERRGELDDGK